VALVAASLLPRFVIEYNDVIAMSFFCIKVSAVEQQQQQPQYGPTETLQK
jgi:hypothetical protein